MSLYISSDTNIWNDFREVGRLDLPFGLDHQFHIAKIVFDKEMAKSGYFDEQILLYGLHLISASSLEMQVAQEIAQQDPRLSFPDSLALSIAQNRKWVLLTGDRLLRKKAQEIGVEVHGTLWILDELEVQKVVEKTDLLKVYENLLRKVRERVLRLPVSELQRHIDSLRSQCIDT